MQVAVVDRRGIGVPGAGVTNFLGCPSWLRTVSALNHGTTSLDPVILIGWLVGRKVGFTLLSIHVTDIIFLNVCYVNCFVMLNLFYP